MSLFFHIPYLSEYLEIPLILFMFRGEEVRKKGKWREAGSHPDADAKV